MEEGIFFECLLLHLGELIGMLGGGSSASGMERRLVWLHLRGNHLTFEFRPQKEREREKEGGK